MESNDVLQHHGVKGMRWGIRRNRDNGSDSPRVSRKVRKQREATLKKARQTREANKELASKKEAILRSGKAKDVYRNRHLFTNEELKRAIDRFDLEKNIKDVDNRQTSRGKKLVLDILEGSAKNVGQQTVTYFMGTGVNKIFADIMNDPNIINPKKGQKDK